MVRPLSLDYLRDRLDEQIVPDAVHAVRDVVVRVSSGLFIVLGLLLPLRLLRLFGGASRLLLRSFVPERFPDLGFRLLGQRVPDQDVRLLHVLDRHVSDRLLKLRDGRREPNHRLQRTRGDDQVLHFPNGVRVLLLSEQAVVLADGDLRLRGQIRLVGAAALEELQQLLEVLRIDQEL